MHLRTNRIGSQPYLYAVDTCWNAGNPKVVHCSSSGEPQVWSALRTCATLYLERVLAASPAPVVVGALAKFAFAEYLHHDVRDHLLGPVEVAGRDGLLVFVRHPNSRGGVKSFQGQPSDAQLEPVKEALPATTS
jgi:hypothetical protein